MTGNSFNALKMDGKDGPLFNAMPEKNTKTLLWLVRLDKICISMIHVSSS